MPEQELFSERLRQEYLLTARSWLRQQMEMGVDLVYDMAPQTLQHSPADSPADRMRQLFLQIKDCDACPLHLTRTHFVFGEGKPDAAVIFIGEAPGHAEDMQGRPFVGQAGQLLNRMLASIEMKREQVFIGNILKCRPPNNRDPLPEEINCCRPHLQAQLAIIRPKIICALGRIAAQTLLDRQSPLGQLRGNVHIYQGIPLVVTYHPAALLRNASLKRGAWEDLLMLRREHDRRS